MAALSAFAAFAAKYATLTNALTLYTFDAPDAITSTINGDGVQVYPTYAVLFDDGTTPVYEMEHTVIETTELRLMIYANSLDDVDAAMEVVKYNGQPLANNAGMDFGTLPALDPVFNLLEMRRTSEHHFLAQATGKSSQRIFGAEMRYRVTISRIT